MNPGFKNHLLKLTNASDCREIEVIQSLWSGYGVVARYELNNSSLATVIVKNISLNTVGEHPRGWNSSFSHNRKVKSYKVEAHWYKSWNQYCRDECRVPHFIGSYSEGSDQWIVLEDLDSNFAIRKQQLGLQEVKVCLKWLANFHRLFLNQKPEGLWEIGTYWHLDTRPDEFEKIKHSELKAKAHVIDEKLNQCKYQTIVHGDAKLANFCFSDDGGSVAAVDFQYVGGGCGMKDTAYFLGSCLSSTELDHYQNELLDFYFDEFRKALKKNAPQSSNPINFKEMEEEWRKLYPFACADFTRFLLGWMPTHQKINDYNLKLVNSVLASL